MQYEDRLLATIDCLYNRPREWSKADQDAMKIFAGQAALAFENARLRQDLEDTYMETILTLARAVDARDAYTAQHSQKLAEWAVVTAQKLGLSDNEVQTIRWAALLHDIGKIGIPDSILRKPGPLTDEEWMVMKRHPELGAQIVAPLRRLEKITPLIRHHQEKYDGSGYPAGLKGEQIPLGARILTVVDAYGAMTDDRVYRRARTQSEAVAELKRCAGQHFDRHIVDVFNQVIQAAW
jgi:putative nucleotidyltransferase with HDIG domain